MNKLLYLLFVSSFILNYLCDKVKVLPHFATWVPEVLAGVCYILVLFNFATKKELNIERKYVFLVFLYVVVALIGIILNEVREGAILIGLRSYFKMLPFFLLPAVYSFSEGEVWKQLKFVLLLLIAQCPFALYQRLFKYAGMATGDFVTGTVGASSSLSVILICATAVVFAFWIRKKIRTKWFLPITFVLLLPTTLNETKVTLLFLPLAIFLPTLFHKREVRGAWKSMLGISGVVVLFLFLWVQVDEHFTKSYRGNSTIEFFSDKSMVEEYVYTGSKGGSGEKAHRDLRRADFIRVAYMRLSRDFVSLAFGLGIGNASASTINSLRGEHPEALRLGGGDLALTQLLWELGLAGILIYAMFFLYLFRDGMLLRDREGLFGSFGLGWCAVIVILFVSLAYMNFLVMNEVNFPFWYFSGIVASAARNKRLESVKTVKPWSRYT